MWALKANLKSKTLQYVEVDKPKIEQDTDVIIKVAFAGLCGTDLHILQGSFPGVDNIIMGHEFCGVIAEISKSSKLLKVGDKVIVNPNTYCSTCLPCLRGNWNLCEIGTNKTVQGIRRDGGWAHYCKTHIQAIHKVPDALPLQFAVLCEPISCIVNGYEKLSPIAIGSDILVIGAGIIGLLWSCLLHLQGHKRVVVSEINEHRRNILKQLDLGYVCKEWTGVRDYYKTNSIQPNICIDCSGNIEAQEAAMSILGPGGKMCIFGISSPNAVLRVSPYDMYTKELSIITVNIQTTQTVHTALAIMESLGSRYLDFNKLGIKTYKLKEYQDALADLKKGICSKAVFNCDSI